MTESGCAANVKGFRWMVAAVLLFLLAIPGNAQISTVSAASWRGPNVAPSMLVTSMATNITRSTISAPSTPWPATLGGVTITLTDSTGKSGPAPVYFVSPGQVNWLIPDWPAPGAAGISLKNSDGTVFTGSVQVAATAPGLFSANATGSGVAAAAGVLVDPAGRQTQVPLLQCGTVTGSCAALHMDPAAGDLIVLLFGTGIRGYSTISVESNGQPLDVVGAAAQGTYAGLDQVNVRIPKSLAGAGEIPLVVKADGQTSNQVLVAVGPAAAKITEVRPSAVARGQKTRVTVTGERLAGVTGLAVYPPDGLTISGVSATDSSAAMDLAVPADAPLGDRLVAAANPAGRSDLLPLKILAMPRIVSLSPSGGLPGQTVNMTITGEYLDGVTSVNFSPAAGIRVSNLVAKPAQVTVTVAIDATAAAGSRQVTVTGPAGPSNAVTFSVQQGGASGFGISNLRLGPVKRIGGVVTLPVFVDFVDPSAKAACDRLEIDILLDAGAWGSIHRTVTGFKAGGACQTSGTLDLTDQWDRFWQPGLAISVKITLTNALGQKSNELTGSFQS